MQKYKYFSFLLLIFLISTGAFSQNCYIIEDKLAGFEQETLILEQESCKLIDSLPDLYQSDFKVLHFDLYLHHPSMASSNESFISKIRENANQISLYYLLIIRQIHQDGQHEYFVEIKLPESWLPNCYDPIIITAFENSITSQFNTLQSTYPLLTQGVMVEVEGIKHISNKLGEFTNCCLPEESSTEGSCTSCISAFDVSNELLLLGFEPFFLGQVINSDPEVDQTCLCDEDTPALRSSRDNGSTLDNANLIFELEGIEYDFSEELLSWVGHGNDAYISKNENYCDQRGFQELQASFDNSQSAVWFHIWENPNTEELDVVFIKMRLINSDDEFIAPDFQQPDFTADPPPPYQYRIVHRSFAPWDRFGHFPLLPYVHVGHNNFHGDNRGFSLAETDLIEGTLARVHQEIKTQLGSDLNFTQVSPNPFSSITIGYYNWQRRVLNPNPPLIPVNESPIFHEERSEFGVPKGREGIFYSNSNHITYCSMFFEGSNPLVGFPFIIVPDVEWNLELGIYYTESDHTVHFNGRVTGRGFPAYEAYLQDQCGNKVFLNTYTAPCESELVSELLWPLSDYTNGFELSITVNETGCFIGDIVCQSNSNSDTQYTICTSIEDWNTLNLLKIPATDCPSIPCEGAYPNDNSDRRTDFNCNE